MSVKAAGKNLSILGAMCKTGIALYVVVMLAYYRRRRHPSPSCSQGWDYEWRPDMVELWIDVIEEQVTK